VGTVFFGDYEGEKWHDMRPLLAIDKLTLVGFSAILILIGVLPMVIAPVVESGILPVLGRVQDAQQAVTVMNSVQTAAAELFNWLGGA
jgi:NADH:ubiquinone oxidoreductase subunit 4 (subunit M)